MKRRRVDRVDDAVGVDRNATDGLPKAEATATHAAAPLTGSITAREDDSEHRHERDGPASTKTMKAVEHGSLERRKHLRE